MHRGACYLSACPGLLGGPCTICKGKLKEHLKLHVICNVFSSSQGVVTPISTLLTLSCWQETWLSVVHLYCAWSTVLPWKVPCCPTYYWKLHLWEQSTNVLDSKLMNTFDTNGAPCERVFLTSSLSRFARKTLQSYAKANLKSIWSRMQYVQ